MRTDAVARHGAGGVATEQAERVATGGDVELDIDDVVGQRSTIERRRERALAVVDQDVRDQDGRQSALPAASE